MKIALLHDEQKCIVIVTTHHVIADGLSVSSFIRDLITIVAGRDLPALPLLPSLEQTYMQSPQSRPPDKMSLQDVIDPRGYAERNQEKLKVIRLKLSSELTDSIIKNAKKRQVTTHCLLSAALAMARNNLSEQSEHKIRICTPVNARKHTELDYGFVFML